MESAAAERCELRRPHTSEQVGIFYNQATAGLIRGEVVEKDMVGGGDAVNSDQGIHSESKACSAKNCFKIRAEQKDEFREASPWPYLFYNIWGYPGVGWVGEDDEAPPGITGRVYSELALLETAEEQYSYFARKTQFCFMLEIGIINAIERTFGHSRCTYQGRKGVPHIQIGRRQLYRLRADPNSFLSQIGLEPKEWLVTRYRNTSTQFRIGDGLYAPTFDLTTVTRKDVADVIDPIFKPRAIGSRDDDLPF